MRSDSIQKKRSPCEKFMQTIRNIFKLSSFPLPETDVRSINSHSPPHRYQSTLKQPKNKTPKMQNNLHVGHLNQGGSSFINIQGIDHYDIGKLDDVNRYNSMETSEINSSVTNLMVSDYIKRFHEKNQNESVSMVLPPRHLHHHIFIMAGFYEVIIS